MSKEKGFKIYLKGEDKTKSVRAYKREGRKVSVTFNSGKVFKYNSKNVKIVESALKKAESGEVFEYLKKVAAEVGLKAKLESGRVINILAQNYKKIKFISPDSLLCDYLEGEYVSPELTETESSLQVIFPFGFNASQKKAVENALENKLSIIEGPPGTGKTQTILNIIANLMIRGRTVAVVSSNNSATQNVLDKLEKSDVAFISAYLGNKTNKESFIENQSELPDMSEWLLSFQNYRELNVALVEKSNDLDKKLELQVELAKLKQELSSLELEDTYFLKKFEQSTIPIDPEDLFKINDSKEAMELWLECEYLKKENWLITFVQKIFKIFSKKISRKLKFTELQKKYGSNRLIYEFQYSFYEKRKKELNDRIGHISKELSSFNFTSKMDEYTKMSLKVFKASLAKKYKDGRSEEYSIEDLSKNSNNFISDYPVILSTTYSLRSSLSPDTMFDYVIIDESSQVDICTGALALSCAKNAVIVGDQKQLSHVVDSKTAKTTDAIFDGYNLSGFYCYKDQSLLSSLVGLFPKAPRTLLREHYRCHPKIIEFCNKKFYGGELIVLSEASREREPLIVYKTVEGNHARNRVNQRQIDVIANEIIPEHHLNIDDGSLGIITPYRNQTNELQDAFSEFKVKADTVDKFQGQENKVVILSTVDNEISEFTDNANRLNVAISRAIEQLFIIVNDGDEFRDKNIGDLIRYVEYNNFTVKKSEISSVFDYLFKSYAAKRKEMLSKDKNVSRFDSENLMYDLLKTTFKEKGIGDLEIALHVPLRMIINDPHLLSDEEEEFVMKRQSHVDFLIFDSLGKIPKFAIEVDGAAFHKKEGRQAERDQMKDEIFEKYKIPLYRFRTDGSNEKERLAKILS